MFPLGRLGKDACWYPRPLIQALRDDSVNRGRHVVHGGTGYSSRLLGAGRPGRRTLGWPGERHLVRPRSVESGSALAHNRRTGR
jgi:hypothetical protein